MGPWGKSGKEYWQNELQNMMGIKSGETQPWELPEFKAMAGSYNSQADNNLNNIIRQLSQRGIQGGAASGVINNAVDTNSSNLLKIIQAIFQQAGQRGGIAADKGLDWQKSQEQLWAQLHGMRKQEDQANNRFWMELASKGAAAAAGAMAGGAGGGAGAAGGQAGGMAGAGGMADSPYWLNNMRYLK